LGHKRKVQDARWALLAQESGTIRKEKGGRLSVALVWPGTYHTGMSALGYLWVYSYLNSRPDALAERFFLPDDQSGSVVSVESARPLADFPIIAASMVLENDYWLLLEILHRGGVKTDRSERKESDPLVVAGGVGVWSNPWPLWPFVDVFLAGEGEAQWPQLADLLTDAALVKRKKSFASQEELLKAIEKNVPGALAPELAPEELKTLCRESLSGAGKDSPFETAAPQEIFDFAVTPAFLTWPPSSLALPPVTPILTKNTEFPQTALVEISRGCPWGCRFCLAGYLYRPHRAWPAQSILKALEPFLVKGAKVGLVSPAVADHPELMNLLDALAGFGVKVGLSSMRLSNMTEQLAEKIARTGLSSLAVAPEGGSERLRAIINKNLSLSEILDSSLLLARYGVKRLKLYFMIGLPGETDDDLEQIVEVVLQIKKQAKINKSGPLIAVSVANFTPKPHTPFQWAPLMTPRQMQRKGEYLKERLSKIQGVELRVDPPKWTVVQGLLARGGPRSSALVRALWEHKGKVSAALKLYGYAEDHPIHRPHHGPNSWEVISPIAGKEWLAKEKRRADEALLTAQCPAEMSCGRCEACKNVICAK
jgi:radical SAM superfamily enzyme YgiQ (UPF0313 family)